MSSASCLPNFVMKSYTYERLKAVYKSRTGVHLGNVPMVRMNSLLQTALLIKSRHGPHRKHSFSIVVVQLLQLPSNGEVFTVPLPRKYLVYAPISRSLYSNLLYYINVLPPHDSNIQIVPVQVICNRRELPRSRDL
jgi:hypothetical protein